MSIAHVSVSFALSLPLTCSLSLTHTQQILIISVYFIFCYIILGIGMRIRIRILIRVRICKFILKWYSRKWSVFVYVFCVFVYVFLFVHLQIHIKMIQQEMKYKCVFSNSYVLFCTFTFRFVGWLLFILESIHLWYTYLSIYVSTYLWGGYG